jgi:hypothetical protein
MMAETKAASLGPDFESLGLCHTLGIWNSLTALHIGFYVGIGAGFSPNVSNFPFICHCMAIPVVCDRPDQPAHIITSIPK